MAILLKTIGGVLSSVAAAFGLLVWLAHVGAYNPYPSPPREAVEKAAFGRSAEPSFASLHRKEGEPLEPYLQRLTMTVNAYMIHYWPTEDREYVGVHPLHNYPLWLKSHVEGYEHFANYEFVTPGMAWDRGFGFCSQVSRIIYSVLRDQGLDATVMEHPNHVVVEAEGRILDADYGIFIPYSLAYVQTHPEIVDQYYGAKFASSVPILRGIYADGWKETSTKDAFDYMRGFEASAQNWKWAPMLMVLWMATAIFDAGLCWRRFSDWLPSLAKRPKLPT